MDDRHVAALLAAGRLLQSKRWPGGPVKIVPEPGGCETYPQAVARVIAGLATSDRARLRELVGWVLDYERGEAEAPPERPHLAARKARIVETARLA